MVRCSLSNDTCTISVTNIIFSCLIFLLCFLMTPRCMTTKSINHYVTDETTSSEITWSIFSYQSGTFSMKSALGSTMFGLKQNLKSQQNDSILLTMISGLTMLNSLILLVFLGLVISLICQSRFRRETNDSENLLRNNNSSTISLDEGFNIVTESDADVFNPLLNDLDEQRQNDLSDEPTLPILYNRPCERTNERSVERRTLSLSDLNNLY